jgi:fluoroquinolone resistance protein
MNLSGPEKEFDFQEFKGLNLPNGHFERKIFTSCVFEKCSFRESVFSHCKFQDCKFQHCDLSLITLKECSFKNTLFENSQLVGVNWAGTNLTQMKHVFVKPVDFVGCVLNHSTFMGANLKHVTLTKCIATDVSFEEADLSHANCTFTDFSESRFLHTNLTETDFTDATNYSIAANINTLRKTKFSLPEAMSLLYCLDIVLKE